MGVRETILQRKENNML